MSLDGSCPCCVRLPPFTLSPVRTPAQGLAPAPDERLFRSEPHSRPHVVNGDLADASQALLNQLSPNNVAG